MKQSGISLTFACDMDENTAWEIEQKGWFELGDAHLPDGTVVRVNFYDPVRLA